MQSLEPRLALASDAKVVSVGVPAAGTYKAGDELRFTVGFDKRVTVTGTPRLDMTIGAAARPARYVAGDGTSALQFRYVVQAGESDGDGITVAKKITLPVGAAISDKSSSRAVATAIAPPSTARVLVDGVRPTIRSIAGPAAGNHAAAATLVFTVSLSEKVTVTGQATLPIEIGGQVRSAVLFGARKDTAVLSFRTVVAAGDFAGNGVRVAGPISLAAGGAIRDAAGNHLDPAIAASLRSFPVVRVDGVGPSVTAFGVPTVSGRKSAILPVTFSEPVTVVGKPTVPFMLGDTARQFTYVGGSGGKVLTFSYLAAKGEALTAGAMVLPQAARVVVSGMASIADGAGNRPVSLGWPGELSLTARALPENSAVGTVVGTLGTTDADAGDRFAYALVGGAGATDNAWFRIAGNRVQAAAVFDFEAKARYSIRVRATDSGGLSIEKAFAIAVTAVRERPPVRLEDIVLAPFAMTNRVAAGLPVGTPVGRLLASSFDNDGLTFALVSGAGGADNGRFRVEYGEVGAMLVTNGPLTFAADTTCSIRLRVTGTDGNALEKAIPIRVGPNARPIGISLDGPRVAAGMPLGTRVGRLATAVATGSGDGGVDVLTYALVPGVGDADNARFAVRREPGDLRSSSFLVTNQLFKVTADTIYSVRLRVTSAAGATFEDVFGITVERNVAPTDIRIWNYENLGTGGGSLGGGSINVGSGNSGSLTVVNDSGSFNVVNDSAGVGQSSGTLLLTRAAPLVAAAVPAGQPIGTFVGWLRAEDANAGDALSFAIVAGEGDTDNGRFRVEPRDGGFALVTNAVFPLAVDTTCSIRLRVTDSAGNPFEKVLPITVGKNSAPTFIGLSGSRIVEGRPAGTVIGVIGSIDGNAPADSRTYELVPGAGDADNGRFWVVRSYDALHARTFSYLVTSEVFAVTADTTYSVRLRTTDSAGNTFEQAVPITVQKNVAPTGIHLDRVTVLEGCLAGSLVASLAGSDANAAVDDFSFTADPLSFALVAGDGDVDNGRFAVERRGLPGSWVLVTNQAFTVAADTTYSIRLRVKDAAGGAFEQVFAITVVNNVAPIDITLSGNRVLERQPAGAQVGLLGVWDANGYADRVACALVRGAGDRDNARFRVKDGSLVTTQVFTVTADTTYSIRLRVTDSAGNTLDKVLKITVVDNVAPTDITLSRSSLLEGKPAETFVGWLNSLDATDATGIPDLRTYAIVAGAGDSDNAKFRITDGYRLVTNKVFVVPVDTTYSIRLRATDSGGNTFEKVFSILVMNNAAPVDITLSGNRLREGTPHGAVVGSLDSLDPTDATGFFDSRTYELVPGEGDADNARFALRPPQPDVYPYRWEYSLVTNEVLSVAADTTYSIRLRVTDSAGNTFEKVFAITIENNVAPTDIVVYKHPLFEGQPAGTSVGLISSFDPTGYDDSATYSLVPGDGDADNGRFRLWSGSYLVTNEVLSVTADTTYSIRLRVTDSAGNTFEKVFGVLVQNNAAPIDITLSGSSVLEGQPPGTAVGSLSSLDPTDATSYSDTRTYALVAGEGDTDNGRFAVVVSSYYPTSYRLVTNEVLSVSADTTYSIRLRATDSGGNTFDKVFAITIANNAAPTDISVTEDRVLEGRPAGTVVCWLDSLDPTDSTGYSDTRTYALVPGEGDSDNARFVLRPPQPLTLYPIGSGSGYSLVTKEVLSVAADTTYSIRLRVTDSAGNTFEKVFVITVVNNAAAPTDITLSRTYVLEQMPAGTYVGSLAASDPDGSDDVRAFALVAGEGDTDNDKFAWGYGGWYGSLYGDLVTKQTFVVDRDTTYSVRLRVTDSAGNAFEKVFLITVKNNVAPTDITLSGAVVHEAQPIGTFIGWLDSVDPTVATGFLDSRTFTLVAGEGDADNARFATKPPPSYYLSSFPVGYSLVTNEVFAVAADTTYSIRLRVTDSEGNTFEKVFAILVKKAVVAG